MNKHLTKSNPRETNPWAVFRNDLWDIFDRFSDNFNVSNFSAQQFVPKIEVKDTGTTYQVSAEVPGMDQKDISVSLEDRQLVIEGEKRNEMKDEDQKKGTFHSEFSYGRFYRAIPLSEDVDAQKISANYKNGVLNIDLPKLPEQARKTKKIEIKSQERLQ